MKYNSKYLKLFVLLSLCLLVSGCASILGDNMRTVCVHSQPEGAGIYVDGQRQGTTPAAITLPNYIYGGKLLVVKQDGYHEQAMIVNTQFQPCGLWNIFFWPGFLIDAATGDTVKIVPGNLNLTAELAVKSENSK